MDLYYVYIRVNVFESDYIKIKFASITFIDISTRTSTSCFTLKALTRIMIMHIKNIIFKRFLRKNVEWLFQSEKHFVHLIVGFISKALFGALLLCNLKIDRWM